MTVSKELLYAILAMDSYNRGYDEGITGLGAIGSSIGGAILVQQSDTQEGKPGVAAGFYAAAYDVDGAVVISYRGTDFAGQVR